MNFGETLAYWYLRLNGFFPLANFVVHRDRDVARSAADVDIVAIRLPHVFEEIGGRAEDWDQDTFGAWGIPFAQSAVGLIVEAKTGGFNTQDLLTSFSDQRVEYAIARMGICPRQDINRLVAILSNAPLASTGEPPIFVAKLLISTQEPRGNQPMVFFHLPMQGVADFIDSRIENYIDRKRGERVFFPSDLIQYMIWRREALGGQAAS